MFQFFFQTSSSYIREVCTGPDLTQEIRNNFSNKSANERGFFQQAAKEKWVFQWQGRATKKGRKIILCVSLGPQNKVLKPADKIHYQSYLAESKCKCSKEMSFSFHYRIIKKNLLFLLLFLNVLLDLHLICSFHNLDLFISFRIDFECLYLDRS